MGEAKGSYAGSMRTLSNVAQELGREICTLRRSGAPRSGIHPFVFKIHPGPVSETDFAAS